VNLKYFYALFMIGSSLYQFQYSLIVVSYVWLLVIG